MLDWVEYMAWRERCLVKIYCVASFVLGAFAMWLLPRLWVWAAGHWR